MVKRLRELGLVGSLSAGLLALAGLLAVAGVVLLVTGSVQFADNVASLLSLTLSVALAGTALIVWYRASVARRQEERAVREREAVRARPEDHWVRSARGRGLGGGFLLHGA